jgi:hypothetical protein
VCSVIQQLEPFDVFLYIWSVIFRGTAFPFLSFPTYYPATLFITAFATVLEQTSRVFIKTYLHTLTILPPTVKKNEFEIVLCFVLCLDTFSGSLLATWKQMNYLWHFVITHWPVCTEYFLSFIFDYILAAFKFTFRAIISLYAFCFHWFSCFSCILFCFWPIIFSNIGFTQMSADPSFTTQIFTFGLIYDASLWGVTFSGDPFRFRCFDGVPLFSEGSAVCCVSKSWSAISSPSDIVCELYECSILSEEKGDKISYNLFPLQMLHNMWNNM